MATCSQKHLDEISDKFKDVYKHFKRRDKPLSTQGVIDFTKLSTESFFNVEEFPLVIPEGICKFPGLKPVSEWKAYHIKDKPGFVVIKNPFEAGYQRYWVQRCLVDFPVKPNTTNIDAHMERPSHVWESCLSEKGPDLRKDSLLMKLRWATLGYQYEWNTKEYFSDRLKVFPNDLAYLCKYIAEAMGYKDFASEAGIVNYYRMESTLMGHTDVSELDKAAPLISFSFGQDCIFLIGGPTKATEPVPLFLHSGDISLMTGAARMSFHAVPRILHADPDYIQGSFNTDSGENTEHSLFINGNQNNKSPVTVNELNSNLNNENVITSELVVNKQNDSKFLSDYHDKNVNNYDIDSNSKLSSDHEMEEDDPYSASARRNLSSELVKQICDNGTGDFSDQHSLSSQGGTCELSGLKTLMDRVIRETDWAPFAKYLNQSRVNVNVRKVLIEGESLPQSPEVIPKCPGKQH